MGIFKKIRQIHEAPIKNAELQLRTAELGIEREKVLAALDKTRRTTQVMTMMKEGGASDEEVLAYYRSQQEEDPVGAGAQVVKGMIGQQVETSSPVADGVSEQSPPQS